MKKLFTIIITLTFTFTFAQTPNYPFPNHVTYTSGTIKPSTETQNQLDKDVKKFYNKWKSYYLKQGCDTTQYYVQYQNGSNICVSEGQGYGMVIVPYMAGYDVNAKKYFDGLYRWYINHPSTINAKLMNWRQKVGCISNGDDSATDGDLDIAFGLLLADKQWGSAGDINYLQEAINIINAIKQSEVFNPVHSTQLGDWSHNLATYKDDTRPSDFMYDHFRSYQNATGNNVWTSVLNECYGIIDVMQTTYSPVTGLIPDFVEDCDGTPHPAAANFLEGTWDGNYNYNSCRVPWHLGADYLLHGDTRAKIASDKINAWIRSTTSNNVNNIRSGYQLDGTNIPGNNYQDLSFIAPFTVSACVDVMNQTWLNDLWANIKVVPMNRDGYYGNTLKMLSMLVITGNYWVPENVLRTSFGENSVAANSVSNVIVFPNPASSLCNLKFNLNAAGKADLRIFNQPGQLVFSETKNDLQSGSYIIPIDVNDFAEGIYFYELQMGEEKKTGKIVVR